MAEPQIAELPCPSCGTLNVPEANRCKQCLAQLDGFALPEAVQAPSSAGFLDRTMECPQCGASNLVGSLRCERCSSSLRRRRPREEAQTGEVLKRLLIMGLRLAAVLYLFSAVFEQGGYLSNMNRDASVSVEVAMRGTMYCIYKLLETMCLVTGVWLLTCLRPGRSGAPR